MKTHLPRFNLSRADRQKPTAGPEQRLYVTFSPGEHSRVCDHFCQLTTRLLAAGVEFNAKAVSPYGFETREDHVVLYIHPADAGRAERIVCDYLEQKHIGQGHVPSAEPTSTPGLSKGRELTPTELDVLRQVLGSKTPSSFSQYVAAKLTPRLLDRLAEAHARDKDPAEAKAFVDEAARVRRRLARLPQP